MNKEEKEKPDLLEVYRARKSSFFQRKIVDRVRPAAKFVLYSLFFVYPVALVLIGAIYGGLVFWGILVGSYSAVSFVLYKFGYSHIFVRRGMSLRWLVGVVVGFSLATFFLYLLLHIRILTMLIH